jgi:hypothetical protein
VNRTCMWWGSLRAVTAAAVLALVVASAYGSLTTFELSYEFSGATPPEGMAPWLTATFDDHDTPGSVDLTLVSTNLTDAEFVFEWLFNLNPELDASALVFSALIKTGEFADPTIDLGMNSFPGDGGGYFDIRVDFENSNGPSTRFGVGDAAEYTITGISTLTADSFDSLSAPHGGNGTHSTAAHVGGIGPDDGDSGWISVPEPATLVVLALGSLALLRCRR